MKKERDIPSRRRITIFYLKDPMLIHKEIREKSNRYIKNGMNKSQAVGKAAKEVTNVQCSQVLYVDNTMELEPVADLVADIAGPKRDYRFSSEVVR